LVPGASPYGGRRGPTDGGQCPGDHEQGASRHVFLSLPPSVHRGTWRARMGKTCRDVELAWPVGWWRRRLGGWILELPPTGGGRSPTNDRQGLGGREQGPTKADYLRVVRRRGGTGAARRLFYHIRPLPYSVSCMAEGQSDRWRRERLTIPQCGQKGRRSAARPAPSPGRSVCALNRGPPSCVGDQAGNSRNIHLQDRPGAGAPCRRSQAGKSRKIHLLNRSGAGAPCRRLVYFGTKG
jgi:hypothetical protein